MGIRSIFFNDKGQNGMFSEWVNDQMDKCFSSNDITKIEELKKLIKITTDDVNKLNKVQEENLVSLSELMTKVTYPELYD